MIDPHKTLINRQFMIERFFMIMNFFACTTALEEYALDLIKCSYILFSLYTIPFERKCHHKLNGSKMGMEESFEYLSICSIRSNH